MVSLITEYNNETLVNDFTFSLSEEESDKLRSNIDSLLVACIADHFMLSTTTSTVQKKYIEKSR